MKTCKTCFFFSVGEPNKNGDAFCYCKKYKVESENSLSGFVLSNFAGQILNVDEMRVCIGLVEMPPETPGLTPNPLFGNKQISGKICTDWVSVEEQEIVNKGW